MLPINQKIVYEDSYAKGKNEDSFSLRELTAISFCHKYINTQPDYKDVYIFFENVDIESRPQDRFLVTGTINWVYGTKLSWKYSCIVVHNNRNDTWSVASIKIGDQPVQFVTELHQ